MWAALAPALCRPPALLPEGLRGLPAWPLGAGHTCLPEPSEQAHHSLLGTRGSPSLPTTELPPADGCSVPLTFGAWRVPSQEPPPRLPGSPPRSPHLIFLGPLPGAPTSSSGVPSPEPPPHLPGSPPRSPRLICRVGRSVPMAGLPLLITEWRRC